MAHRGSLDFESVIALRSQFDQVGLGEFEHVIVDISELTSIDPAGTRALGILGMLVAEAGAELRLRDLGGTMAVRDPAPGPREW